jgi:hypothetical protein
MNVIDPTFGAGPVSMKPIGEISIGHRHRQDYGDMMPWPPASRPSAFFIQSWCRNTAGCLPVNGGSWRSSN